MASSLTAYEVKCILSHYATVAINIYLASNLKMIHKKAQKLCKILRLQFRLQYARWYGLYKNAIDRINRVSGGRRGSNALAVHHKSSSQVNSSSRTRPLFPNYCRRIAYNSN